MQDSESIRARLRDLETAVERSGSAVIAARTAYDHAIRRAVLINNDHDAAEQTQAVLRTSEREHGRAADMADRARQLLAETLAKEQREARVKAQIEIEGELSSLQASAGKIDAKFDDVVSELLALYRREIALHRFAKNNFQAPLTAPRTLATARVLASALTFLANQGEAPETQPHMATAIARAATNVRDVYDV